MNSARFLMACGVVLVGVLLVLLLRGAALAAAHRLEAAHLAAQQKTAAPDAPIP